MSLILESKSKAADKLAPERSRRECPPHTAISVVADSRSRSPCLLPAAQKSLLQLSLEPRPSTALPRNRTPERNRDQEWQEAKAPQVAPQVDGVCRAAATTESEQRPRVPPCENLVLGGCRQACGARRNA